ncbi:hypothetical protein ANN_07719 [Periplaneta americana]|uniref:Mos1 transposase HTH domain-containing protein n=1 Tax=Periplaneta americana TaxID=6978 RepID=A0ABQ8T0Z4_PERAM|nr:hypothetical protein ANN_07719 [Periplaneta americana]
METSSGEMEQKLYSNVEVFCSLECIDAGKHESSLNPIDSLFSEASKWCARNARRRFGVVSGFHCNSFESRIRCECLNRLEYDGCRADVCTGDPPEIETTEIIPTLTDLNCLQSVPGICKVERRNKISARVTLALMRQAYGEAAMSRTRVYEWHRRFTSGRLATDDDPRPGRPRSARTEEMIARVAQGIRRPQTVNR